MGQIEPRWWNAQEFAEFVGITTDQASKLRISGDGPPFVKFGRAVRYLNLDVLRWHQEQRMTSTKASRG